MNPLRSNLKKETESEKQKDKTAVDKLLSILAGDIIRERMKQNNM